MNSLCSFYLGIINTDDVVGVEFVETFANRVAKELAASIITPAGRFESVPLIRCLSQLVAYGIVDPKSLWDILDDVVKIAGEILSGDLPGAFQPYTDHLICLALGALPFGGEELLCSVPDKFNQLLNRCSKYVDNRPYQTNDGLKPFAGKVGDDDQMFLSDCGAASHLTEMLRAIEEMRERSGYSFDTIPRLASFYEEDLLSNTTMITLRPVSMSGRLSPQTTNADTIARDIIEWYPPRGIIRFLKEEHTKGDRLLIERIIAEDYFLHTMHYFEGDRVECAKRLARSMPLNYAYDPLLCEVIFGQMLRLPDMEFKTVMYGTLMVDLCKLVATFPRAMSACVRECFSRMSIIDPYLRQRLAEWLAYHVSNYDFAWPWQKWSHVLDAPKYDCQRRFCADVIARMIRLSYWDRIHDVLPEQFRELLPPKPQIQDLPSDPNGDLETIWASKTVDLIRKRTKADQLDDWMKSNELEAVLGGKVAVVRMLLRALLVAGQKTYSHMIIALERYYGPLAILINDGGEEAQMASIDTIWQVWRENLQRAAMAVDRMMTLRLVSANTVVGWVFKTGTISSLDDQHKYNFGWESLHVAVNKVIARVDDVKTDIAKLQQDASSEDVTNKISAKQEVLKECEKDASETLIHVVKNFVKVTDNLFSSNEAVSSYSSLESIDGVQESASKETVLFFELLLFTKAFIRHYHQSFANCTAEIRQVAEGAKIPLTQSVIISSLV